MKQLLLLAAALLMTAGASAQDSSEQSSTFTDQTASTQTQNVSTVSTPVDRVWKKNFVNIYYSGGTLKYDNDFYPTGKNSGGFGLGIGHTYFLHEPIADVLRFGIDATWFEYNFNKYHHNNIYETYHTFQNAFAMGIGISATYQPISKFCIKGYFHYKPTLLIQATSNIDFNSSTITTSDGSSKRQNIDVLFNYASVWTAGLCVSYKFIGLGAEARWCNVNLYNVGTSSSDFYEKLGQSILNNPSSEITKLILDPTSALQKVKVHNPGFRIYVQFKF